MPEILVVEDDSRTAREIIAALSDAGVRVTHAATGMEAITRARQAVSTRPLGDRAGPGRSLP